jgi:transcriptional antiterminator RfaH
MSGQHQWYVVHTHARAEATAVAHLERQGFGTYCPRYLKRHSHARRVTIAPAPFFPRYIFVAMDLATQRWRTVRSTLGVSSLVGSDTGPTPVSETVVADLRAREDAGGFIPMRDAPRFLRGDRVRSRDGVFCEYAGLFDCMADSSRVVVLLELLGRKVRVVLDSAAIIAA